MIKSLFMDGQKLNLDLGLGFGSSFGPSKNNIKREFFFSLLKTYDVGDFGIDLTVGGNLNPYRNPKNTKDSLVFNLNPSDNSYTSISFLYRYNTTNLFYLEPRIGYSSLGRYVETNNNQIRVSKSNMTFGLGIGKVVNKITFDLRYQYLGKTANYEGIVDNTLIKQDEANYSLIILRVSYSLGLDNLFKKKNNQY